MTSFGTWIHTAIFGHKVGSDEFGNRYYVSNRSKLYGRERRWVIYNGRVEASKVPPEWHAWLHQTVDVPLSEDAAQPKEWQLAHLPNLSGTRGAYVPEGSDLAGGTEAHSSGVKAWRP
ncbi:MAG: NADH:ubiquinone oxidoreductase subunit NDUFA12 [Rhodospirillaceae bacterium]|nr:NADH:ubiquinone oxidoreductase subunit NDUFA12 [Rhodospirillaceae bacterium]